MTFLNKLNSADLFGLCSITLIHLYFARLWFTGKREEGVGVLKSLLIGAFWFIAIWIEIERMESGRSRSTS